VRFQLPKPKPVAERTLKGAVLKVDKFGNLITNFTPENSPAVFASDAKLKITVAQTPIAGLRGSYAEGKPGELFGVLNSMGYLEIACNRAAASNLTKAGRGAEVLVEF